jgi:hypothetical protein
MTHGLGVSAGLRAGGDVGTRWGLSIPADVQEGSPRIRPGLQHAAHGKPPVQQDRDTF